MKAMTHYCPSCDAAEMMHDQRDISFTYKGRTTIIPALSGWHCPNCDEAIFDGDEGIRHMDAVQAFVAQVNAEQAAYIRAARKRLHMSQKDAAAIFGGGVNAFSEYERGITQPHKSTMLLLTLLDKHPELLAEISQAA